MGGSKPSWSEYYLGVAEAASKRSSCVRAKVGAVIVSAENRVVSLGYNDAPAGMHGCEKCPRRLANVAPGSIYEKVDGVCHSVHAEQNALLLDTRSDCEGETLFVT